MVNPHTEDNRAKMTRLLYLDRKYYEKVHGHSKEEYCDRTRFSRAPGIPMLLIRRVA